MSLFKRSSISALITLPAIVLLLISPDWRHKLHAEGYYGYGYGVDLILDLVQISSPVIAGGSFSVSTETSNNSINTAEGAALVLSLDPEFSFFSSQGCNNDPIGFPVCELGRLTGGESQRVNIRLDINSAAVGSPQVGIFASAINTEDAPGDESLQFSPPLQQLTDISVMIENGTDFVMADGAIDIEYLLSISNIGFSDGTQSEVQFDPPTQFNNEFSWVCFSEVGSSCTPAGSNLLNDNVDLNAGSSVIYVINGSVDLNTDGVLVSSASASPAASINDPNTSNNNFTDEDVIGLFANGFENGDQPLTRLDSNNRQSNITGNIITLISSTQLLGQLTSTPQIFSYLRDNSGRALVFWQVRYQQEQLQIRGLLTSSQQQVVSATTDWISVTGESIQLAQSWGVLNGGGIGLTYQVNADSPQELALTESDNRELQSIIAINSRTVDD